MLPKLFGDSPDMPREERELLSSTAWSFVIRLAGMVASFIFGVQLARLLNPEGFGVYGIVVAIGLLLSVVAQFGLQTVATREISIALAQQHWSELRGNLMGYFTVVLGISTLLAMVWAVVATVFPTILGPQAPNLAGTLLVPVFALTVLISAELRALGRIVSGQALEILVRPALMCGLLFLVALFGRKLSAALAVGFLVTSGLVTLAVGLVALRSAVPKLARRVPKIRPTSWAAGAASLAAVDLLKQLDATYGILLVGVFSDEAEAGFLRVALSAVIFVATPISIFNVVLAPSLATLHSAGDRLQLQRILSFSAITMFITSLAALAAIALVGKSLITIVFGAAYTPAWMPLLLLTAAQAINAFFGVGWVLLSMSGGERKLITAYFFSVMASILIAVPLTLIWGARGAAAAAIVGALIQNSLTWRAVRLHSSLESSAAGFVWRAFTASKQHM